MDKDALLEGIQKGEVELSEVPSELGQEAGVFGKINKTDMGTKEKIIYGGHEHIFVRDSEDSDHTYLKCSLCGLGIIKNN